MQRVLVNTDDLHNVLLTLEEYRELTFNMSPTEYSSHSAELVEVADVVSINTPLQRIRSALNKAKKVIQDTNKKTT